ncbi:phosphatidylserine decarboxylase [Mycobacterium asiaticum]|uniref:Phosphatidylserine decarboxylase n=1 Tax=Mycobacterium asiaticum TaxID=1790 RepID=A0A1A3N7B4_MYCAS|nr:phosphatidylserine decarboxylase [Mycobacterium asiaticum]
MSRPDRIVEDLQQLLKDDPRLRSDLERSIRQAHDRAASDLDPTLRDVLDWPQNLDDYYRYVQNFIRWIPRQSDNPAWRTSSPGERYAKEVSDRLAHFFWLVDQRDDDGGPAIERSPVFRSWLTDFARQWGSFLDTPDSFNDDILRSFLEEAPDYTVEESLIDGRPNQPSGWLTFNQFFARELNPGLRPISEPSNNMVVTSPADCSYRHTYGIDAESNIPATTVKGTHRYGNIRQLLEGSRYADSFANGTFVHYMLPPSSYHRYHAPVGGFVRESFVTTGQVYMQVDLVDGQLESKDSSQSGYEFFQTRGVLVLDTAESGYGDVGVVAVVPVGMSHVASVNLTTVTDTKLPKGEEFGFFAFGGSDIIILFQEGIAQRVDTDAGFCKVGSPIAHLNPASPAP